MLDRIPRVAASVTFAVAAGAACGMLAGCGALFEPHMKQAEATVLPTRGNTVLGKIEFVERADGVQITYSFSGFAPDTDHGFHVNERGDCSTADTHSALGRFDPPGVGQSEQGDARRPVGDLPNIHADSNGTANGFMVAPELALDGVRSIVGHAIVVDRNPEDYFAQQDTYTGPPLACGVIRK